MSALTRYPEWPPGTPRTDPTAQVCRYRAVVDVRVMRITNGHYRRATVNGTFELYKPERNDPVELTDGGKMQVQVICAWHGGRPNKNSGVRVDLGDPACHFEVLDNFSGKVVDNIGRTTNPLPLADGPSLFPDEVAAAERFWEGATRRITVNAYERDVRARRACIAHFGTVCRGCGFDFATTYGELGRGFIHVHHTRPLSEIRAGNVPNPKRDLIPVCPNCHAMLHQTSPPLTIAELQKRLSHATNVH